MKRHNLILISILSGMLISAFPFYYLGRNSVGAPVRVQNCDSLKSQAQQIQNIAETDYKQYLTMPTSQLKCDKAEELLNRVIVLFLTDLAHHMRGSTPTLIPNRPHEERIALPSAETKPAPSNIGSKLDQEPTHEANQTAVKPKNQIAWATIVKSIKESRSEKEAVEALDKIVLPNLAATFRAAVGIGRDQLTTINGKYTGAVTFIDGREPWHIEWTVDGSMDKTAISGNYEITMAKQGKQFSRSRGNITAKTFKVSNEDHSAIIIDVYGHDGYLQLYPVDKLEKLVGNMYLKVNSDDDISQATRQATVVLERVR